MPRGAVAAVGVITALHATVHIPEERQSSRVCKLLQKFPSQTNSLLIEVEAPAMRHADDLRVGGEGAAVEGAPAYRHPPAAVP